MTNTQNSQNRHTIYLGLGTNTGDRQANLEAAVDSLVPQVEVTRRSPIYQTPPWGYTDQPDFLNMVVEATTRLTPAELLKHLKEIEEQVGRTATFRWGPREIDVDILFYDEMVSEMEGLTIPHPHLHERAFVLVPMADLAPGLVHPVLHKTIEQLKNEVDQGEIKPFSTENIP